MSSSPAGPLDALGGVQDGSWPEKTTTTYTNDIPCCMESKRAGRNRRKHINSFKRNNVLTICRNIEPNNNKTTTTNKNKRHEDAKQTDDDKKRDNNGREQTRQRQTMTENE